MTPIADMIRRMVDRKVPIDVVIIAVETYETEAAEKTARRKEQNRKAQQNHRARKADNADKADSADQKERSPTPPKEKTTSEDLRRSSSVVERASRLKLDWQPSDTDLQYALGKGLSNTDIATEVEKFRNYWLAKSGKDATKIDWSRTWQNRILDIVQWRGIRPPAVQSETAEWIKRDTERIRAERAARHAKANGNIPAHGNGTEGADRQQELLPSSDPFHPPVR